MVRGTAEESLESPTFGTTLTVTRDCPAMFKVDVNVTEANAMVPTLLTGSIAGQPLGY